LAADHAVDCACCAGDFGDDGNAAGGVDGSGGESFECQSEKRVAGQDGGCFAEFFVVGGFAAAEVVVVERGEVVVNQRVRVDEFDGARGIMCGGDIRIENAGGF
jgi:hypothetical protein